MKDERKTKKQLIEELTELRGRMAQPRVSESGSAERDEVRRRKEEEWERTFDAMSDWICLIDVKGRILRSNRAGESMLGIQMEGIVGQACYRLVHGTDKPVAGCPLPRMLKSRQRESADVYIPISDRWLAITVDPVTDEQGDIVYAVHIARDITERKQLEGILKRTNRALTVLSQCTQAVARAFDEELLLDEICRIAVEVGGFRLAWICFADAGAEKKVHPVAQAGFEVGYLETLDITWADTERGQGPTGTAIRTGKPSIVRDIMTNPDYAPWREEARKRGYRSSIALPLGIDDVIIGALNIYASEPDAFDHDEIELLKELADSLTHGIVSLRTRLERQRAREDLRESEERFRDLYENAPTAYFSIDTEGCIRRCNRRVEELLGYGRGILLGRPIFDVYAETLHGKAKAEKIFQRFLSGESIIDEELQMLRADGSPVWVSLTVNAVLDEAGNVRESRSMVVDITERKRMEQALREQRDKAQKYLDTAGVMFVAINARGEITLINQRGCEILGYGQEEIIGCNWFDNFLPERMRDEVKSVFRKLITGERESVEYIENPVLTKNNGERIIAWHNTILRDEADHITGTLSSGEDITGRVQAEKALRKAKEFSESLITSMQDGFSVLDNRGVHVDVNPAFCRMTGFSREELIGIGPPYPYWPPEAYEEIEGVFQKTLRGEFGDYELTFRRKNGERFPVIINPSWITNEQDGIVNYLATVKDISERKKVENELAEVVERDEALVQALGEIVYDWRPQRDELLWEGDYTRVLGYSPKEMGTDTESWTGRVHLDDLERVLAEVENATRERRGYELEYRFRCKDGSYIWMYDRGVLFSDTEGRLERIVGIFTDISERKLAEKDLARAKEQLQFAIDGSGVGLWDWYVQNGKTAFNERWANIIGYTLDEIQPVSIETWIQFAHPEDLKKSNAELEKHFRGETETYECEARMKHKSGVWVWVLDRGKVVEWDADGKPLRMTGTHLDITERKRVEKSLRESEAQFRALAEQSITGITLIQEGKWIYVNPRMAELFGYTQDDMIGRKPVELVVEADREIVQESLRKRLSGEIPSAHYTFRGRRKDGTELEMEVYGSTLTYQGRPTVLSTLLDITERKRAEEALGRSESFLDSIIEHSPHAMWISDREGTLIRLNKACRDLLHITDDEVVGKYNVLQDNIIEEQGALPLVKQVFEEGKTVTFSLRYDSSRLKHLELEKTTFVILDVTISPVLDAHGQVTNAIIQHLDITERKRIEEEIRRHRDHLEQLVSERTQELEKLNNELEQANIRLQEADRLKSIFLASMSHELRTPLNSIIGFSGILLMGLSGELNEEQYKQLSIVKDSANHLLSLINDILDISKIEADKVEISLENFGLNEVVEEIIEAFTPVVKKKNLKFTRTIPKEITLWSDRRRFKQVLMNLLSNAVKFTDRGYIRLTAEIVGDGVLQVSVADTGIGIKREEVKRLFEPFQQVKMSLEKTHEGTGLGLYLVKKLIILLGGEIEVESEFGEGSLFVITIPLKYQEVKEDEKGPGR